MRCLNKIIYILGVCLIVSPQLVGAQVATPYEAREGYSNQYPAVTMQEPTKELSYRMKHPNSFSLSFGDASLIYSINYDRTLVDWAAIGISGSYVGTGSSTFGAMTHIYTNLYPVRNDKFALLVSPGVSLTYSDFDIGSYQGGNWYGVVGVGMEYRKQLLIRVKLNMLFNQHDFFAPWPGVTIGASF